MTIFKSVIRLSFVCGATVISLRSPATAQTPTLVYPKNQIVTADTNLVLEWNVFPGASGYHLQIDNTTAFSSPVAENPNISAATTTFAATLSSGQRYFWRLRANTANGFTGWSAVWSFTVFSPADANVTTWYKADFGVRKDSNGRVYQWDDASGNGNHMVQTADVLRPLFVDSAAEINNYPLVRFDGTDDYLTFTVALTSIETVFWVVMEDPDATVFYRSLLGDMTEEPHFHRGCCDDGFPGTVRYIYDNEFPRLTGNVRNGTTRVNGVEVIPLTVDVPKTMCIISTQTVGDAKAENFSNDRNIDGGRRVWDGDLAELIFFNERLNDSLTNLVFEYLSYKYAPPVNLGADRIESYRLCDTIALSAGAYYTTLNWSTGSTGSAITVTQPGTYRLSAVNQFGRTSSDSVTVQFVYPAVIQSRSICHGDSIVWNTGLSGNYAFQWQDGSTGSSYTIRNEGDYWVRITDTTGCSLQTPTVHIDLDSFAIMASLGDDTTVCRGQNIGLVSGAEQAESYLWSTGSTDSVIAINSAGSYSLTVTDAAGCVKKDTIDVLAGADAPSADFSAPAVCDGLPTLFTDQSTPAAGIIAWSWDFGDGTTSVAQHPSHNYSAPGSYPVTLTVTAANTCKNYRIKTVQVYNLPQAFFSDSVLCVHVSRQFNDESVPVQGAPITSWRWDFGDGDVFFAQHPFHEYDTTGTFSVTLIVADVRTCRDTFSRAVESIPSAPPASTPDLLLPQNDLTISTGSVLFDWQPSAGALSYTLQVATDPQFTNIIRSVDLIADSATLSGFAFSNNYYYWKVIAYNICGEPSPSAALKFKVFQPTLIPGLCMWLSADRGLVRDLNGNIATWLDNSTALNNASQADATKRPKQVPHVAELNGAPVLRFNEETSPKDDHLIFDNRIQQIRTVFWVIKENPNASIKFRHVLGDTDTMPFFHRGCCRPGFPPNDTTKTLWSQDYTSSYVINGTTRLNMQTVNGLQTNAPTRYSILSVKTTAGVEANAFVIDRFDVTHEYRTWDGDLAELLIYCQPLSDELIRNVEAYLNDKYAPPVNLGPDIVLDYGFCTPVQLCAGDRFVSYFWSTGDTTPCITANGPGVYSVIATNIFGVTSVDAVHITGGLNTITFDDTIHICMGDSVVWDTQLGYDYYFEWQKGDIRGSNFQTVSNDSFYIIREPGYYFVKVTDSFLCSATTDTIFASYDSFRVQATLGPDTLLCDGNRLRLIAGSEVASSYLWSDNTTDSTLTVTQTGDYSLTVQNIHGCIAHDTVYVEIFGVAPHADFSFDRTCFGDTTEFTEQSTSFIIAWRWSFGDGTIDVTQHPEHYYQTPGTFNVKLIVTDSTGCSQDATKQVVIYPLPEARFTHELANCANEAVNFTDASAVQPGQTITAWQWTFGDNAVSNSQHPSHLYQNSGLYPVSLTVTTNRQCVNTAYDTLEIFPELVAGIRAENLCFDLTARFCDNSPGHSNVAWYWDFGDMFTSTKECPLHNFPDPGDYVVTLQVRNAIGCVKTVSDTITITARPTVDFDNPSLCERKAFQFTDKTITNSGDDVVAWRWNFGDQTPVSVAENPFHAFADAGAYTVRLDVQTRNGCASSATKTVEVIAPPVADFDFSPKYGAAPLTVTFSNHSTGASGYVWNFGDGSPLSLDDEPVHVFQQNEAVIITLVASNLPGCSDTAAKPLTIATATLDVSLEKIILSHHFYNGECTYLLDMSAFIINNGTIDVTGFDITASNSAGGIILEHWDGNFNNRQLTYEFAAQFLVTDCGEDVVICMEVIDPNGQPDQNPSNNRLCTTLSDDLVIIGPYPNPAGDFTSLDVLLPAKGNFRLTNYNILGRELGRLSGQREEGYHSISIDTRHLPSGVYFLVVEYLDDECVLKYAVR